MPKIKLTDAVLKQLQVPDGKRRIEWCDEVVSGNVMDTSTLYRESVLPTVPVTSGYRVTAGNRDYG